MGPDPAEDGGRFRANDGFVVDKQRLKWSGESSTRLQLDRCVSGELLPQQRSSANLVTQPSWIRSLRTQYIISSRVVSAPGIPIAHMVYTRFLERVELCHSTSEKTDRILVRDQF